MSDLVAFLKSESGSSAIEYGLIAAGVSSLLLATISAAGTPLKGTLDGIAIKIDTP